MPSFRAVCWVKIKVRRGPAGPAARHSDDSAVQKCGERLLLSASCFVSSCRSHMIFFSHGWRSAGLVLISGFQNNTHSITTSSVAFTNHASCSIWRRVCLFCILSKGCASGWRWLWQLIAITVAFHCLLFSLRRLILGPNIWNPCVSAAIAVKWGGLVPGRPGKVACHLWFWQQYKAEQ